MIAAAMLYREYAILICANKIYWHEIVPLIFSTIVILSGGYLVSEAIIFVIASNKPMYHIISGVVGLIITLIIFFDNFFIGNEFGWQGTLLFIGLCLFTLLVFFILSEVIMFVINLISNKNKETK